MDSNSWYWISFQNAFDPFFSSKFSLMSSFSFSFGLRTILYLFYRFSNYSFLVEFTFFYWKGLGFVLSPSFFFFGFQGHSLSNAPLFRLSISSPWDCFPIFLLCAVIPLASQEGASHSSSHFGYYLLL